MGSSIGPQTVTSGLVYNLDAANSLSMSNVNRNYLTFPEDITNAVWGKFASGTGVVPVVVPNFAPSPDGTSTADLVTFSSGGAGNSQIDNPGTLNPAVGTVRTFSVWMRTLDGTTDITMFNGENIQVVTVTSTWQRFAYTLTITSGGAFGVRLAKREIWSSGGTGSVLVWGAQWEDGPTATTYVSVSASTRPTTRWNNLLDTAPLTNNDNLSSVEVLVVAGGGAGAFTGSGGGAGGVIYNNNFLVSSGSSYTVTVGEGGFGAPFSNGQAGANSVFGSLTAIGGGGGVTHGTTGAGQNGGSGGGAAQVFTAATFCNPGLGTDGQGFMGGQTPIGVNDWPGGSAGGGGAGGPGTRAGANIQGFGNGGIGRFFQQFSTVGGSPAGWFGGGGGGGEVSHTFITVGGLGGGGTGTPDAVGSNGVANTGGGGAGGGYNGPYYQGGNGGSGVVIVRYPLPIRATGGTITTADGNAIHTFRSGTSTFVINNNVIPSLQNGLVYTSANSGGLTFDGVTGFVSLGDIADRFSANQVTIISFATINSIVSKPTCVSFNGNFNVFYPGTRINATPTQMYWDSQASWRTANTSNLSTNQIYCFAWTIDRTNLTFYRNGQADGTTTVTNFAPTSPVRLGLANAGEYHTGTVYNLQIYNRALSATEIAQNFNALRGRYGI